MAAPVTGTGVGVEPFHPAAKDSKGNPVDGAYEALSKDGKEMIQSLLLDTDGRKYPHAQQMLCQGILDVESMFMDGFALPREDQVLIQRVMENERALWDRKAAKFNPILDAVREFKLASGATIDYQLSAGDIHSFAVKKLASDKNRPPSYAGNLSREKYEDLALRHVLHVLSWNDMQEMGQENTQCPLQSHGEAFIEAFQWRGLLDWNIVCPAATELKFGHKGIQSSISQQLKDSGAANSYKRNDVLVQGNSTHEFYFLETKPDEESLPKEKLKLVRVGHGVLSKSDARTRVMLILLSASSVTLWTLVPLVEDFSVAVKLTKFSWGNTPDKLLKQCAFTFAVSAQLAEDFANNRTVVNIAPLLPGATAPAKRDKPPRRIRSRKPNHQPSDSESSDTSTNNSEDEKYAPPEEGPASKKNQQKSSKLSVLALKSGLIAFSDRYKFCCPIPGLGNMAEAIIKMEDVVTAKCYARKSVPFENGAVTELRALLAVKGAKYCAQLSDVAYRESDGQLQLMMPFLQCNDIESRARENAQQFLHDGLWALAELEALGVVHCDVKLGNFGYDLEHFRFVLFDFGCAVILPVINPAHRHCFSGASDIAPEAREWREGSVQQRPISCALDVYALGNIAGSLLTHTWFYRERKLQHVPYWSANADVPRWYREHWSELRDAVSTSSAPCKTAVALDLIQQMIEVDPTKRITASRALRHPLFAAVPNARLRKQGSNPPRQFGTDLPVDKNRNLVNNAPEERRKSE